MRLGEREVSSEQATIALSVVDGLATVITADVMPALAIMAQGLAFALIEQPGPEVPAALAVAGLDTLQTVFADRAQSGVMEDWEVPDDPLSVTGKLSWTRVSGTHWTVAGGRALLTPGQVGLEFARCEVTLGVDDQEVSATLADFIRNDATMITAAVLARVDLGGATTFYQGRAVFWAGGDFFDVWRTIDGAWTRIAGPIAQAPQPNDRMRLRVTGSAPPTVQFWVNDGLLAGPLDDAGGIASGPYAGIYGEISGGSQAVVALDDWIGLPLGAPPVAFERGESAAVRLTERSALFRERVTEDTLALRTVEWPIDAFLKPAGLDAVSLGLIDAAGAGITAVVADDGLPIACEEGTVSAVVGLLIASAEAWILTLIESVPRAALVLDPSLESLGLDLGEAASVLDTAPTDVPAGDLLAVGAGEQGSASVLAAFVNGADLLALGIADSAEGPERIDLVAAEQAPVSLAEAAASADITVTVATIVIRQQQTVWAGITGETVGFAGVVAESTPGPAGVSGETTSGAEEG